MLWLSCYCSRASCRGICTPAWLAHLLHRAHRQQLEGALPGRPQRVQAQPPAPDARLAGELMQALSLPYRTASQNRLTSSRTFASGHTGSDLEARCQGILDGRKPSLLCQALSQPQAVGRIGEVGHDVGCCLPGLQDLRTTRTRVGILAPAVACLCWIPRAGQQPSASHRLSGA